MLPKTKLGKQMFRKLKVYAGDKHPHQAQQPVQVPATGKMSSSSGEDSEWRQR